jgi:hydrogenase maturation protease
MSRTVVIGVGNPYRGDDGVGIEAARALRELLPDAVEVVEHDGEPAALIDVWEGSAITYVIDAVRADDAPGTIHRIELDRTGAVVVPHSPRRDSSHALGLGDAVDLARVLERLPDRLVVLGVTGDSFALGDTLSRPVHDAIDKVASEVAGEIAAMEVSG